MNVYSISLQSAIFIQQSYCIHENRKDLSHKLLVVLTFPICGSVLHVPHTKAHKDGPLFKAFGFARQTDSQNMLKFTKTMLQCRPAKFSR